jgi:hypothetical protein
MRPSLALTIVAIESVVVGVAVTLFPSQMLAGFGLGTATEALIQSRDLGVSLISLGIINWTARGATGAPLRGILWGNIFFQVVGGGAVHAWEIAAGQLPSSTASFLVIPLALTIMLGLALRRPEVA